MGFPVNFHNFGLGSCLDGRSTCQGESGGAMPRTSRGSGHINFQIVASDQTLET